MPRIIGVDIPKEKRIEIALSYIYGIGRPLAFKILEMAGVPVGKRAKDLSEEEVSKITSIIQQNYRVEGDLKRDISGKIKRLMEIGSYRGIRHRKGLPVRGQRTSTNARTRKGPKRTAGAARKKTTAESKPAAKA